MQLLNCEFTINMYNRNDKRLNCSPHFLTKSQNMMIGIGIEIFKENSMDCSETTFLIN